MERLKLTKGAEAIIDSEDYGKVMPYKWFSHNDRYAATNMWFGNKRRTVKLHRFILNLSMDDGKIVDHINGNGLDNRKCNLRITDNLGNARNCKLRKDSGSKYKGVSIRNRRGTTVYEAYVRENGKRKHVGTFYNEEEAADAYNKEAKRIYGEFARPNEIGRIVISEAARIETQEGSLKKKYGKTEKKKARG